MIIQIMFREEVEEFFASMDRDFDGRLSFEEFMGEVTEMQSENTEMQNRCICIL